MLTIENIKAVLVFFYLDGRIWHHVIAVVNLADDSLYVWLNQLPVAVYHPEPAIFSGAIYFYRTFCMYHWSLFEWVNHPLFVHQRLLLNPLLLLHRAAQQYPVRQFLLMPALLHLLQKDQA